MKMTPLPWRQKNVLLSVKYQRRFIIVLLVVILGFKVWILYKLKYDYVVILVTLVDIFRIHIELTEKVSHSFICWLDRYNKPSILLHPISAVETVHKDFHL